MVRALKIVCNLKRLPTSTLVGMHQYTVIMGLNHLLASSRMLIESLSWGKQDRAMCQPKPCAQ